MNSQKMDYFVEKINWFFSLTPLVALKNGMIRLVPFTIVGSIFILLGNFPWSGWAPLMSSIFGADWKTPIAQVQSATSDMIGLIVVFSIAYEYGKIKVKDPLCCAAVAISCFVILIPGYAASGDMMVASAISKSWFGGAGTVCAIFVGLVVGALYSAVLNRNITIKLPDSVPSNVANSFTALIPAAFCIILAFLLNIGAEVLANKSFAEMIYGIIQIPLQGLTGSLGGYLIFTLLQNFFWFFGIHSSVVGSVFNPFLKANAISNQAIVDAGMALTLENGAYLFSTNWNRQIMCMSGSGITIGLVLAMLYLAKSKRYKALGKLAIVPTIFQINEPVLFGFPIAYNVTMFIPFILTPIVAVLTGYFFALIGFMPLFTNFTVPWTTPPLLSGFLIGGWRLMVIQIIVILESFFIYLPFFKKMDNQAYKEELAENAEANDTN
ncbi:PTS sugar transporter subunit IIC [Holdemania massiliensis]|uniref:PTS sugar transporter subunit IIC n=1 Tax=Holdemania massiliensis TaxID=1468449 RepID=UPI001F0539D0|nr:PTS transporter subunit EIIC [Holdemania massiliensis]MCH1939721.1 PTS transporter subunit EIIC [Holdemania massiliensis]